MKNDTVKRISHDLCLSRPTVSRALRHCAGVDSETRELVLERVQGTVTEASPAAIDVYAILPDVPKYFWSEMLGALGKAATDYACSIKFNVYTKLGDEGAVLHYLNEAEALGARVILLAARITAAIERRLTALSRGRLILLLSEFSSLPHTFYVGADPVAEGYAIGREYCRIDDKGELLLLSVAEDANAPLRIEGFLRACREAGRTEDIPSLTLSADIFFSTKLLPAKLAAELAPLTRSDGHITVYASTAIPQLSLALRKAGIADRTSALVHDPESDAPSFVTVCRQNLAAQAVEAIRAAHGYLTCDCCPDAKYRYVPSILERRTAEAPPDQKQA